MRNTLFDYPDIDHRIAQGRVPSPLSDDASSPGELRLGSYHYYIRQLPSGKMSHSTVRVISITGSQVTCEFVVTGERVVMPFTRWQVATHAIASSKYSTVLPHAIGRLLERIYPQGRINNIFPHYRGYVWRAVLDEWRDIRKFLSVIRHEHALPADSVTGDDPYTQALAIIDQLIERHT